MLEDPMLDALTETEIQAYQSQGFILRRSVFSRVEIEQLNAAIDRLVAAVIAQSHEGQEYRIDGRRFVDLDNQTLQFEPAPFEQDLRVLEPAHPLSSAQPSDSVVPSKLPGKLTMAQPKQWSHL